MKNPFYFLLEINSIVILAMTLLFIGLVIWKRVGIVWYIKQLIAIYSDLTSFFSKKRIESGMAFATAIFILLSYDYIHRHDLLHEQLLEQLIILFGISGYVIDKIQKEKTANQEKCNEDKK